jgi:MYXO-CTERM domain-containing protein
MNECEEVEGGDSSRIARGLLGAFVLLVAGVAFFRRKRRLVSTVPLTSEEWEDYLGI